MRALWIGGLVVSAALWAGACGDKKVAATPKTEAAAAKPAATKTAKATPMTGRAGFVDAATTAVRSGDAKAFEQLMMTPKRAKALCPDRFKDMSLETIQKQFSREKDQMLKRLGGECKAFDWNNAKQISVSGGSEKGPVKECAGLVAYRNIEVHYDLGGQHVVIVLEEPGSADGGKTWMVAEAPVCSKIDGPAPKPWGQARITMHEMAKAYADATCACKDAACAQGLIGKHLPAIGRLTRLYDVKEDDRQAMLKIMQRGNDCFTKLREQAKPTTPAPTAPAAVKPTTPAP